MVSQQLPQTGSNPVLTTFYKLIHMKLLYTEKLLDTLADIYFDIDDLTYTVTTHEKSKFPPYISIIVSDKNEKIAKKKFKKGLVTAKIMYEIEVLRMSKLN